MLYGNRNSRKNRRTVRAWNNARPFVRLMQKRLLQKALAIWPRRDAPLLEINCGAGDFLRLYWQSGFEIVATEPDADMRMKARQKKIPGLDLQAATDDFLPFDDDCFDWVILNLRNKDPARLEDALLEALRVSKRGIMITFWNNSSLAAFYARLTKKTEVIPAFAVSWRQIGKLAKNLYEEKIHFFSTLWAPDFAWRSGCPFEKINACFENLPFGAWCILRIDLGASRPLTALPLRISKRFEQNQPAFEYVNKSVKK